MPDKAGLAGAFKRMFGADMRLKLIVAAGICGMALIFLSQFIGGSRGKTQPDPVTAQFTTESYVESLETRLAELVTGMEGVGEARIMITLETSGETVYAQEEKRNTDTTRELGEMEEVAKVYQKENVEQKYILVDTEYGRKEALVKTQLQPRIQGVVIVCEGANNVRVQQNLIQVITTALGIPSTRVCVVQIG